MTTITPIDYSLWSRDPNAFAAALGQSFVETGFAIIDHHPVDQSVIDAVNAAAKDYFALPEAAKKAYEDADDGYQRGHSSFGVENAKGRAVHDLKEFWHTGRALDAASPYRAIMKDTPSVTEVASFDGATRALYHALDDFGRNLMEAVAIYLELDQNWWDSRVDNGNSILRLLHYPPQMSPPPEGTVRAGAHEDINLITLLLGAEEAGLQAKHKVDGWIDVNPSQGSLVVNCGDMLQRFTACILPSTTHRVLNPTPERAKFPRYSMPFFMHLNPDAVIKPIPSCLARGGVAEPEITAADYLYERLVEIGLIKP
ncbi:isopenicillin N synthase family dioxygenase [Fretibacter rubidus]|uniref:isopenicillin N synthase family dioxygenase n=1 Tax=Fretibacter rubidus TaxID=570162 RepID=UPI00352BBAD7